MWPIPQSQGRANWSARNPSNLSLRVAAFAKGSETHLPPFCHPNSSQTWNWEVKTQGSLYYPLLLSGCATVTHGSCCQCFFISLRTELALALSQEACPTHPWFGTPNTAVSHHSCHRILKGWVPRQILGPCGIAHYSLIRRRKFLVDINNRSGGRERRRKDEFGRWRCGNWKISVELCFAKWLATYTIVVPDN